jgi:hypothetical protein
MLAYRKGFDKGNSVISLQFSVIRITLVGFRFVGYITEKLMTDGLISDN